MSKLEKIKLSIEGMTCASCAVSIDRALETVDGVLEKNIVYADKSGIVEYDKEKLTVDKLVEIINSISTYRVVKTKILTSSEKNIEESISKNNVSESEFDYDLIIVGGGSAAFSAAITASELEKKTLMINEGLPIGGTCVNVGCVPSKTLIRTAEAFHNANNPRFEGVVAGENKLDFQTAIRQKDELVNSLRQAKYIDVIKDDGNIDTVEGFAKIVDSNTVEFNGTKKSAEIILLAVGSSTFIPDIPGLETVDYLTNDTLYKLKELPESLVIIGGRYIALENAQIFARFGSKVTVLQRSNRILPDEAPDITDALTGYLEEEGVEFRTGVKINKVFSEDDKTYVNFEIDGRAETIAATGLLIATGRKGNAKNLGLEEIGVEVNDLGFVKTDEFNRTSIENIYAAGDVTGEHLFVYTAAYAGALSVKNAFGDNFEKKDYSTLPWVIFTDPQVAGVGMDENQAFKNNIDYDVAVLHLKDVPKALAARNTKGFIKLIRDKSTDKLIGARILASEGSELLMEISLAIKFGVTVKELKHMFHPYLTLSEGIKLAAITFDKDVSKLSCCAV